MGHTLIEATGSPQHLGALAALGHFNAPLLAQLANRPALTGG